MTTLLFQAQLTQAFNGYSIPAAFGASDLLFGWKHTSSTEKNYASTSSDDEGECYAANDQENKLSTRDDVINAYRHHTRKKEVPKRLS